MSPQQTLLKAARLLHLYLGVFIAPALLFFAITGGLQTFSLHETTRGSNYQPPALLVKLSQLHKKQSLVVSTRRQQAPTPLPATASPITSAPATAQPPNSPEAGPAPDRASPSAPPRAAKEASPSPRLPTTTKNLLPMKIFFAVVSLGLITSTLTGLYMAYRYTRKPLLISTLWLAGILIPALVTLL